MISRFFLQLNLNPETELISDYTILKMTTLMRMVIATELETGI